MLLHPKVEGNVEPRFLASSTPRDLSAVKGILYHRTSSIVVVFHCDGLAEQKAQVLFDDLMVLKAVTK